MKKSVMKLYTFTSLYSIWILTLALFEMFAESSITCIMHMYIKCSFNFKGERPNSDFKHLPLFKPIKNNDSLKNIQWTGVDNSFIISVSFRETSSLSRL